MKYVTIVDFTDKYTGDVYYVGDKYPLKGKAKKAQPEPEEDIGKGTGFLFDMLEEEPEHSPEAEKSSSEGEKKLEFQPEDATAELAEPASEPKNEDSLEEAEQLAQNLMREDASDMKEIGRAHV